MAAFYIDHCLSPRIAGQLIARGHRAVTTRARHQARAGDDEQLLTAARNGEILVTANGRDYTLLHDAWQWWSAAWGVSHQHHAGILIALQAWDPATAAHELDLFVQTHPSPTHRCYSYRLGQDWLLRA
ncbi:MAG TPA: DUF5615 family PIN-like protein [Chloroflexota bacterium]|nr:DUF5615 family PIN-like protein [Chloroflexota bacterium]